MKSYQRLRALQPGQPILAAGLMSGTSVDSVDAALVRIDSRQQPMVQLVEYLERPFPDDLRQRIFASMHPNTSSIDSICQLNVEIGEFFAQAVQQLLEQANIAAGSVEFIGSHGQTVYHIPVFDSGRHWNIRSTMQIGDPSVIAERTGITTVGEFRIRDIAAGGIGAPLTPFFQAFFFANDEDDVLCQNIGGIANCCLIPKEGEIVAFDSGPGNIIMDAIARKHVEDLDYDEDGELARRGTVLQPVLDKCLSHPYFKLPPPKATGHELFGSPFFEWMETHALECSVADLMATACELTALTMENAYRNFVFPIATPKQVFVSGGGSKNKFLMERLAKLCPELEWKRSDEFGLPSDAMEAMAFAVLAYATLNRIPGNIPSVTNAKREVVLGKVVFA